MKRGRGGDSADALRAIWTEGYLRGQREGRILKGDQVEDYRDEHPYRCGAAVGAIRMALIQLEGERPNVALALNVLRNAKKFEEEASARLEARGR